MRSGRLIKTTKPAEYPHVGDLCRCKDDNFAFATQIVTEVRRDADEVTLAQLHCKVAKYGMTETVLYTAVEYATVPITAFLADWEVYVVCADGTTHNVKMP
jgi:hypothetical protein